MRNLFLEMFEEHDRIRIADAMKVSRSNGERALRVK